MSTVKTLLVALPFAGGNCYSYNFLRPLLQPHIVLETLEYPGRGGLSDVGFIKDMDLLAAHLLEQYNTLLRKVQPETIVLYGHSFGAAVGLELLRLLSDTGIAPQYAIFSGRGAPSTTIKKELASLSGRKLVDYFKGIGAISEEAAAHDELMEYILPILRNDVAVHESYSVHDRERVAVPLMIINGKQDDILQKDIDSWRSETSGDTQFHYMDGHHFFITQHSADFSRLLTKLIINGIS